MAISNDNQAGPALCFFCCYCAVFLGITSVIMYSGVNLLETGKEYQKESTEESCLFIDFEATECSYDCNCSDDECDTCYGTQYQYYATVESKCGNDTLYQTPDDYTCPMDKYDIGTQKTCYVLGCDEEEFSLIPSTHRITWGIVLTVLASLLFCCALVCLCAALPAACAVICG